MRDTCRFLFIGLVNTFLIREGKSIYLSALILDLVINGNILTS